MNSQLDKRAYARDGYVVVRGLFAADEVELLDAEERRDTALRHGASSLSDAMGASSMFSLWYDLADDLYSRFIRDERVIDRMEEILEGGCYHYHSKIIYKEPGGGAWRWHQDYGYWYNYGFLFPRLASCMLAIDPATAENGCLRVLAGSHAMGRMEHRIVGEQLAADEERLAAAERIFERHDVPLAPGDAVFFHCNLLHGSPPNESSRPRRCLITSYNSKSNLPYEGYDTGRPRLQNKQPSTTDTEKVPAGAIRCHGSRKP